MWNKIKNPTTNQTIYKRAATIKYSNYSHGNISNVPIGTVFPKRIDALKAKVHGMSQAGIHSRKGQPAYSIVLNDGYIDDEDFGDSIIYTGEGGNDPKTKHQIRDQTLTKGNLALTLNITNDVNGIILSSINELKNVILDTTINNLKYIEMGYKAKEYYYKNRTPLKMANGLEKALKYTLQIK